MFPGKKKEERREKIHQCFCELTTSTLVHVLTCQYWFQYWYTVMSQVLMLFPSVTQYCISIYKTVRYWSPVSNTVFNRTGIFIHQLSPVLISVLEKYWHRYWWISPFFTLLGENLVWMIFSHFSSFLRCQNFLAKSA